MAKTKTYTNIGWTPEQEQMARVLLGQGQQDIPAYSQMRRGTYQSLADLVGSIQPNLQAQVLDPMRREYELKREQMNAQMGPNYWASSRQKILGDMDTNYAIQQAKTAADLMMQANQMRMSGLGQLLEQDPTRLYASMLQITPKDMAVVPGQEKTFWNKITGGLL